MLARLKRHPLFARAQTDMPFWVLAVFVPAIFLFGGGARDDILSLIIIRPLAALVLVYALFVVTADQVRTFRTPLLVMAAIIGLIALHLVPLPPAVWSLLPGREIVVEGDEIAGLPPTWRPLALVPWRAWNALFAMLVPAAAMLLAIRCRPEQRRTMLLIVIACGFASCVWGMLQAVSGYRDAFYFYSITNYGSPTGLFSNRNHQAAMICAMLPLLAVWAGEPVRGLARQYRPWLAAAFGSTMLLVLLITGSRAGLLLSTVGLGSVALLYRPTERTRSNRLLVIALLVTGVAAVALLAATFLDIGGLDRLLNIDAAEEGRFQSWPVIVDLVKTYFPVGSGIGSFVEVYMVAEPNELLTRPYLNHAHSDVLEWVLEGGVPAALLVLAAVFAWGRKTVSLLKTNTNRNGAGLALAAATVILVLGLASLVDYPLRAPSLAVVAAIAAVWMADPERAPYRRAEPTRGKAAFQSNVTLQHN